MNCELSLPKKMSGPLPPHPAFEHLARFWESIADNSQAKAWQKLHQEGRVIAAHQLQLMHVRAVNTKEAHDAVSQIEHALDRIANDTEFNEDKAARLAWEKLNNAFVKRQLAQEEAARDWANRSKAADDAAANNRPKEPEKEKNPGGAGPTSGGAEGNADDLDLRGSFFDDNLSVVNSDANSSVRMELTLPTFAQMQEVHDDVNENFKANHARRTMAKKLTTQYLNQLEKVIEGVEQKGICDSSANYMSKLSRRAKEQLALWECYRQYLEGLAPQTADFQGEKGAVKLDKWLSKEADDFANRTARCIDLYSVVKAFCKEHWRAPPPQKRSWIEEVEQEEAAMATPGSKKTVQFGKGRADFAGGVTAAGTPMTSTRTRADLHPPPIRVTPASDAGSSASTDTTDDRMDALTAQVAQLATLFAQMAAGGAPAEPRCLAGTSRAGARGGGPPDDDDDKRKKKPKKTPPGGGPPGGGPPGGRPPTGPPGGGPPSGPSSGGSTPKGRKTGGSSDIAGLISALTDAITTKRQESKLPSMKLLDFHGEIDKFTPFWDVFYAIVHSKKMSDVEKLNHLQSCLKGNAVQVYKGFKLTGDNYKAIIRRLKAKYGNKRLLLSTLIRRVLYRPQAKQMSQARDTIDFLWAMTRQLEGEEVKMVDPAANLLLLSVFESKIPEELLNKWELHLAEEEEKEDPPEPAPEAAAAPLRCAVTLEQFLKFCETRIKAAESAAHIHADGARSGRSGGSGASRSSPPSATGAGRSGPSTGSKPSPGGGSAPPAASKSAPAGGAAAGKKKGRGNRGPKTPPTTGLVGTAAATTAAGTSTYYASGCIWCGGNHATKGCGKGNGLPTQEKWDRIRRRLRESSEEICFQCFEGHKVPDCSAGPCGVNGCQKRHHKSLHSESNV